MLRTTIDDAPVETRVLARIADRIDELCNDPDFGPTDSDELQSQLAWFDFFNE
jgi:hypothetical protein